MASRKGTRVPKPEESIPADEMPDITGPGHQTSKYKTEYNQMLIDHMSRGLSFESFGGVINFDRATLYNWANANPSFLDAKRLGMAKCRLYWETIGVAYAIEGGEKDMIMPDGSKVKQKRTEKLNSSVYRLNMINRFGWKNAGNEDGSETTGVKINIHAQVMEAIKAKNKKPR